ncbi:hypothetical protein [Candidatus Macondimonas diazotrophica]|jgi:hypothetical protein|uniref:Phage holin n=1 Tax=Candidatus Macondimonas diazotrophica TaxID=2305248 RepID=A0A4Z0F7U4_9GAMM|nr:hypothetical protein [Candidatus Macondimonas diazotrophica]TFZ81607.1 hypothetical protein E4680_11945 [Candidatus Macondimonas diazotrophica]
MTKLPALSVTARTQAVIAAIATFLTLLANAFGVPVEETTGIQGDVVNFTALATALYAAGAALYDRIRNAAEKATTQDDSSDS